MGGVRVSERERLAAEIARIRAHLSQFHFYGGRLDGVEFARACRALDQIASRIGADPGHAPDDTAAGSAASVNVG